MKEQKRMVYHCDFCKKKGFQKASIQRHENSCTANPNRVCRMCRFAEGKHATMEMLVSAAFKGLDDLRAAAGNCPACILAGIRRAWKLNPPDGDESGFTTGGGHSSLSGFRFREEIQAFWRVRPRRATDYD